MATPSWSKISPVIRELLDKGEQFDFYLALYWLEQLWSGERSLEGCERDRVKIYPDENISFPAADIRDIRLNVDKKRIEVKARFGGLFGVNSPLPQYFIEAAIGQHNYENDDYSSESGERVREFLNIFNHHLYCLNYSAWKKYQPLLGGQGKTDYLTIRDAITHHTQLPETTGKFYGLASHRVQSSSAVEVIIKRLVPELEVKINDQVEHWVPSLDNGALGNQSAGLGEGSVLGERMLVVGGRLDIEIGPMNSKQCRRLLPGGDLSAKVQSVLDAYLSPALDYQLVLTVKSEKAPIQALKGNSLVLGKTTWLGENPEMERRVRLSKKQLKQSQPISDVLANAA